MPSRRSLPQRVSNSFRVIKDLDFSHRYERQVGLLALLVVGGAILVAAAGGGWLWRRPVTVVAEFDGARGLSGGDVVLMAGVPVGRVRRVELVETGRVRVTMVVRREHRPRRDAALSIVAVNVLGDVAVSYQPGSDPTALPAGEMLAGRAPEDLGTRSLAVRQQAEDLVLSGRAFLRRDFAADVGAARAATARARAALANVRGAPLEALTDALIAGQAALGSLDSLVALVPVDSVRVRLAELGENAGALLAGVGDTRERLASIQARLDSGRGNVGLATRDSALRRELDATRRSLDDVLFKYTGRRPAARRAREPAERDSIE